MGGNALKEVPTRRYDKVEYFSLWNEIKSKLKTVVMGEPKKEVIRLVEAYRNKESFGDMDIILCKEYFDIPKLVYSKKSTKSLMAFFNYKEMYRNMPVISFDYKDFQIDLIFTKEKFLETSDIYYRYNDLGNLMGRIANKFGTRYGHMGLEYKFYALDDSELLGTIPFSQNMEKIFTFLGFDFKKFNEGFDELKDVFDYVVNSEFFEKSIFDYENLNHQNRTRNKKRDSYRKFLEYIETPGIQSKYEFKKDKNFYLPRINEYFPEAKIYDYIEVKREEHRIKKEIASKFNGIIIMRLKPQLNGIELGKFISSFKLQFEDFNSWVLGTDQKRIEQKIVEFYNAKVSNNTKD